MKFTESVVAQHTHIIYRVTRNQMLTFLRDVAENNS